MPYLIDGHNLIPHIGGMRLDNPNDEQRLIRLLQVFASTRQQKIEVFFDCAMLGKAGPQTFGQVTAHFVVRSSTADAAISARLRQLGKSASGWTVVSSDREVQAAARQSGARIVSSEEFAAQLINSQRRSHEGEEKPRPSAAEVNEMLDLFKKKRGQKLD
ncbi:MAG: NYN domain-containing protein [Chloroflexota bacterium]